MMQDAARPDFSYADNEAAGEAGPTQSAYESLRAELDQLERNLMVLEKKISPALGPHRPMPVSPEKMATEEPPCAPMTERIRAAANHARSLSALVTSMTQRVEL